MEDTSSESQMKKIFRDFAANINKSLVELTGSTRYKIAKGRAPQLHRVMTLAKALLDIDINKDIDPSELKIRVNQFFEEAKKLNDELNSSKKHPADIVVDLARFWLDPPSEKSTLHNTRFMFYRNAAFEIARKVRDSNKVDDVRKLYQEIPERPLKEALQHAEALSKKLGLLEAKNPQISARTVERYWEMYFKMCGHFETIVRLLIGVDRILHDRPASYLNIKEEKTAFGNHLKTLRSRPHFKDLVEPVNQDIRNSYAHPLRTISLPKKLITFTDNKGQSKEMTFPDFIQQTRELAAAMIVASHLDSAIILPDLEAFRDFLKHNP